MVPVWILLRACGWHGPSAIASGAGPLSCPHCVHCTSYTSPEAIHVGKITPALRLSRVAGLLDIAAPVGALERMLQWVESLRGKRGPSAQVMTFVAHDDEWTKLLVHLEPEVVGGSRRGRVLDEEDRP